MGVTGTIITGAAAAIGAGGVLYSAHQRKQAQREQASELEDRLEYEAERREREEEKLLSRQRAAYAASGVRLEGTPLEVIKYTQEEASREREELLRRGQYTADLMREEASDIWTTGMWNTTGTLLSGVSATYRTGREVDVFK